MTRGPEIGHCSGQGPRSRMRWLTQAAWRAPMSRGSILVVDDDPEIRTAICLLLDLEGYAVRTAAHGQEALREVEGWCPQLVLLDMQMPVMDGWGFARSLHEHGIVVKVLVVTAGVDGPLWAREIQADGYMAKPFEIRPFLAEVERLCSAASADTSGDDAAWAP